MTTIHDFLKLQRFTRKKFTKIALERFSQANMLRRQAFISWRQTIDPRKLFSVDETGFFDFWRNHGRIQANHPLPSFSSLIRPDKTSVLAVAGFHGVVQAIPFDGNFTAAIFEYAMENIVFPALPNDCYVVMDSASIHNGLRLSNILAQKNITLVKLPPYSYDLNPIEMVFSLAKAYSLRYRDIDNKAVRILQSFYDILPATIQNFYPCSWRIQY